MKQTLEFQIDDVLKGKNSILFRLNKEYILYEKLSNTLHSGSRDELLEVRETAESVIYNPRFEAESLKKRSNDKLDSLLLNVTESCGLRCSYCIYSGKYEGERINGSENMNFETAKKAVDFFVKECTDQHSLIGFYGGEPLNNIELVKATIEYSKTKYPHKKFVFSITSNFVEAQKHLDYIVREGIYINISLDGPQEVHDKQRPTTNNKPTFEKILANIKKLDELSPGYVKSHIGLNGTYEDPESFSKITNYFLDHEEDFFVIRVGGAETKGLEDKKTRRNSAAINKYASMYLSSILNGKKPSKLLSGFFDSSVKSSYIRSNKQMPETLSLLGSCYPGQRKVFVDTTGKLYMCEKFGRKVEIGNVDDGLDKSKIEKSVDDFTNILNNYCTKGCWAQRLCTPCIQSAKDPESEISVNGLAQKCSELNNQALLGLALYATIVKNNTQILNSYFIQ